MKVSIDDHHHSNRPQGERTELGLTARWTSSVTEKNKANTKYNTQQE
jgi:hypothetical protein